ncbi:MAG: Lrp/AsnC family transcriptional regulator [Paracoccaceae bacterium]
MLDRLDITDQALLDDFQRDFPLVDRPFAAIAARIAIPETEAIARLRALKAAGTISRVGATVRPNTAGASTLAALAVPDERIEEVAAIVGQEDGVNHSYLREHDWNLWFVATAPDPAALQASLHRIGARAGLDVLDLRLKRAFNIDLGFSLRDRAARPCSTAQADLSALRDSDRPILHALSQGLDLVPRPYAALAARLGCDDTALRTRIGALARARLITRLGVIVRHRAVGWSANAMVVWTLPDARIEAAGTALARLPGVTLCYQRETVPGVWPHGLFSMIHARSRSEALEVLDRAARLPELHGADHQALFSTRCFKQTGAQIARNPDKAA